MSQLLTFENRHKIMKEKREKKRGTEQARQEPGAENQGILRTRGGGGGRETGAGDTRGTNRPEDAGDFLYRALSNGGMPGLSQSLWPGREGGGSAGGRYRGLIDS